jgi:hypothetical protein
MPLPLSSSGESGFLLSAGPKAKIPAQSGRSAFSL